MSKGSPTMSTNERKIRIAWVETDAPPPVVETAPVEEAPAVVVDDTERERLAASRERTWSIALWVGTCGLFLAAEVWLLPAFLKEFREFGVQLPVITTAVLGTPRWFYAIGVLTLLHAASVASDRTTRGRLRVAAFLALVLGGALTAYGLLAPIAFYDDRL